MANRSFENVINIFFPNKCACCKKPSRTALCADCGDGLRPIEFGRCTGCGKLPKKCVCKKKRYYKQCISAFDFNTREVRSLIYKLKSSGSKIVVAFLAEELAKQIKKEYEQVSFDCITYVPTSSSKLFSKGFDHARLLAQSVARKLSIPLVKPPIKRIRAANQKFQKGNDRKKNAQAAFEIKKNGASVGRVLLIDDVMTSGSTLYRCAELLKLSGADEVYCATAANA